MTGDSARVVNHSDEAKKTIYTSALCSIAHSLVAITQALEKDFVLTFGPESEGAE